MARLSKERWLDHGLQTLTDSGFMALKADLLAKALGVSRGSFYWHFANLAAFHTALLERWKTVTVDDAIETVEEVGSTAASRLRHVISLAADSEITLEYAMRVWADSNDDVRNTVAQVDALRLAYLEHVLADLGLSAETAFARARIVYFAFLGQMMIGREISAENRTLIADELIRLATTQTVPDS